jgi:ubiquinone biosynthesis protein COQ9
MATKTLTVRPLLRPHPLKTTLSSRTFHSYDHPPPPGPFNATESLILSSGAPYVPAHGFTHKALSLGAKDAGYIDASTNLFPAGPFALVHWHLYKKRVGLAGRCRDVFENKAGVDRGEKMGIGQKVKALTWERLMGNREVIGRWQEV